MPNGHLSLIHYRELIDDPDWARSILLSLRIGVVGSAIRDRACARLLARRVDDPAALRQPLMVDIACAMIAPPIVSAMTSIFLVFPRSAARSSAEDQADHQRREARLDHPHAEREGERKRLLGDPVDDPAALRGADGRLCPLADDRAADRLGDDPLFFLTSLSEVSGAIVL